ncbi:MAG TPA: hypothetical protein VK027_05590 [Chitinophagaceae bacterium]|nr:hypothetical protein [Chitinophagaceae bacterium]
MARTFSKGKYEIIMQEIEPYYNWRHLYVAEEDPRSSFFGKNYSEFEFSQTVYNYFIHPQWDEFGSDTLYLKILYADYDLRFVIIEFIGEWNDVLENDIKSLKENVLDDLMLEGINQFIFITENIMNIHVMEKDYYEEWHNELEEMEGWVACINTLDHVEHEWRTEGLGQYMFFYQFEKWRTYLPLHFYEKIAQRLNFLLH